MNLRQGQDAAGRPVALSDVQFPAPVFAGTPSGWRRRWWRRAGPGPVLVPDSSSSSTAFNQRDELVCRAAGTDRYLVPERVHDGPRWPEVLRGLLIPRAQERSPYGSATGPCSQILTDATSTVPWSMGSPLAGHAGHRAELLELAESALHSAGNCESREATDHPLI
jgi:hypothetical protein